MHTCSIAELRLRSRSYVISHSTHVTFVSCVVLFLNSDCLRDRSLHLIFKKDQVISDLCLAMLMYLKICIIHCFWREEAELVID